ncbi:AAA family ATPase [Pseudoduganella sp. LjRoot289]|uniref:ATP-binding protein n=1 Tax=Pseudoduganella sp. LjRoot289 TaxID=3342314 RepID=UPI003ECEE4FF
MSLDQPSFPPTETPLPQDGRVLLDATLLKRLRKTRGLSQEALADLCFQNQLCVSIASIKRAESGKIVLYRTARHLAQVFGVGMDQLTGPQSAPASASAPAAASGAPLSDPAFAPAPAAIGTIGNGAADEVLRQVVMLTIQLAAPQPADSLALRDIGSVVQQFGGRVERVDGGCVSAVFGLPQAFRSDAERCMRCAIELNRHLLTHGGRAMAMSLARWIHGAGAGAAPDLRHYGASGMAGMQDRPGSPASVRPFRLPLYVERNLLPLLDHRFLFSEDEPRYPGYLAFVKPAASDASQLPPLIGRYTETRQFKAVVEGTEESQCGHIIYLRAMAGVGKSRLAQEFADIARQHGMRCHRAEVQDLGADNGWRAPLEQLARSLLGLGSPLAHSNAQAIAEAVARLYLPAESALFYHVLAGVALSAEQHALYSAMSPDVRERGWSAALQTLVLRLAMTEPQLIALEDVHWGDPYLFEALGPLLALSREAPVLWVITSRVENDPLESALRQQMVDLGLSVFDLPPMSLREAAVLADQFGDVDPAYRALCVERAQGNPLFLTQLLASPGQQLPDSLRHLIQARLDGLPPEHAQALHVASVLGHRFELDLLRAALGQPDYEPQPAGRNSLLRPCGAGSYGFVHDLVMHCIYDAIEPAQQRRLHLQAAQAWRGRDAVQCAHHLYRANDPGALEVMLSAIQTKLEQHQFEAALDLTAACNTADSTSFSSFPLALLRAHASAGMGHMGNARRYYEHAMLLAGRPQDKIDAVVGLASTLNVLEELEEEERLLDETVPLALAIGAEAALGKLLYLKGNIYFPRGNYNECRRLHEDAARYAQASDTRETQARALSGVGDSYYAQGRMRKAFDLFGQCLVMCEQDRFVQIEASNRAALGSTRIYLGDAVGAVRDAQASAAIARKVGNRRAETFACMTAGWALVADGLLDAATQEVESGLELARSLGSSRFETFLMESQARITWLRGDHALAERQILSAAQQMERLQLQNFIGPWVLGTLALFSRDAAVRKRALLQGAAHLTRDCLAHNAYRFHLSAAEVSLLDGDTVAAEFYAGQMAAYAAQEDCCWIEHHTALVHAYAEWLRAPSEAQRQRLALLHARSAQYGYTHAAPRLHLTLQTLLA